MNFVAAHVIPRSFFKLVRGDAKYAVEMKATRDRFETPYWQAGVSDASILCEQCEAKFTRWDTYGFDVLKPEAWNSVEPFRASATGVPLAIPLRNLDYDRLSLFILSVLWRASLSTLEFYAQIDLGPYEARIRDLLWTGKAPAPEDYAIMLGTSLNQRYPTVILRPGPSRNQHLRFWRLFFPDLFVMVKVDSRLTLEVLRAGMLQPREVNILLCYPYQDSPYAEFFEGMNKRMYELRKLGKIRD